MIEAPKMINRTGGTMKRAFSLCAFFGMLIVAVPASAIVQIDFSNGSAGQSGQIVVNGANVSGTNIPIGALTVSGAGAADGLYDTFGTGFGNGSAIMNFSTNRDTLGNPQVGGFIQIVGGICALGNTTCNGGGNNGTLVDYTTLLFGSFTSWTPLNGAFFGGLLAAQGQDFTSPFLLNGLGISTGTQFSFFAFNITGTSGGSGSPFTPISTDILNTAVPEPATIVLLGTMLLGVGTVLRRRVAKS
jgi:hypothetical protein